MTRVFHTAANVGKIGFESVIIRQVEINGKKYAVALYFPRGAYWKWMISRFPVYMASFIFPLFTRGDNLHQRVTGIRVTDMDAKTIPYNKDLYLKAYRMALVWICIYLYPFFNPRFAGRFARIQLELAEKIGRSSKNRTYPESPSEIDRVYFEQLKNADRQVIDHLDILEGYSKVMSGISNSYKQWSEKTTDRSTIAIEDSIAHASNLLKKMSQWCSERANSWPKFVDSYTAHREVENSNRPLVRKYGPRIVLDFVMAALLYFLVPGVPFGILVGEVQRLGFNYVVDLIQRPKWQTRSLLKASRNYLKRAEKVDAFRKIFKREIPQQSFIRV